jgi:CRISPR-associated endonuclease/helicase Cas3
VLLVPAEYGGCDRFGWAPGATEAVVDLGSLSRRRARIHCRPTGPAPELAALVAAIRAALDRDELSRSDAYRSIRGSVQAWLKAGAGYPQPHQRQLATTIQLPERGQVIPIGADEIVVAGRPPGRPEAGGEPVRYDTHVSAVEELTVRHAHACHVSSPGASALRLAARYHDLGKLDPRFQAWLAEGTQDPDQPLAKSGGSRTPQRIAAAREAAGWPAGKRHELLSAALVARAAPLGDGADDGLVLHLIATHHGFGRPFFNAVEEIDVPLVRAVVEGQSVQALADAIPPWPDHAETMARLEAELGIWGLAYLEALLVLADRHVSASEGAA